MIAICRDPDDLVCLHQCGVLELLQAQGVELSMTDIAISAFGCTCPVFNSLTASNVFTTINFDSSQMQEMTEMYRKFSNQWNLALSDFSVIYHATCCNGVVFTQEIFLARACKAFNVEAVITSTLKRSLKVGQPLTPKKMKPYPK